MAHSTFTLSGKHTSPSGAAHVGSVKVTPNAVIRDVAGALVMAGPDIVKLDASGAWSLVLPCDSPGLNPATGIGFTVEYLFRAESLEPQSFYATADLANTTVDAASLVTTTVAGAVTTTIGPQIGTDTDGAPFVLPATPGAVPADRRLVTDASLAARYVAVQRALELHPLYATGHSWIDGGRADLWWLRVVSRYRMITSGYAGGAGYSGRTIGDVALATLSSPGTDGDTRTLWTAGTRSLVLAVCTTNDSTVWKGTPASHVGYRHAWRALLSQLTGDTPVSSGSSTFVYDSTFSAVAVTRSIVQGAATNATAGRQWRSTTVGGYFEFTVTGPSVDVVLMARAAGAGLVTFTMGGTTVGTLDLTAPTAQDCPAVAQLRGLGAGSHTIRGALTSGESLTVDSYRVPLANPTQGLILGEPELTKAGSDLASWWADVQAYKAELATIVAEFPTFAYLDLEAEPGWDKATMTTSDGKHPNDRGSAWIADRVASRLLSFDFTAGMHVTGAPVPAAYVPPAGPTLPPGGFAGDVIMTDTAPYTGTTDTGSFTWAALTGTSRTYRTVDVSNADVVVKAKLTAIDPDTPAVNTPGHGLAVRVSDANNGIHLEVTPTVYKFARYNAGTWSQLNSYGVGGLVAGPAPAVGDVIELRTKANVVQCYINGVKVMEHTNLTQNQAVTKHGLVEGDLTSGTTYSAVSIAAA